MYATRDDMVLAFGEKECGSLTDRDFTGDIDDEAMNGALNRASAESIAIWRGVIRCRGRIRREFWLVAAVILPATCCAVRVRR